MWPFSNPIKRVEKQMKRIYPSDLVMEEYIEYLVVYTPCPSYIVLLLLNVLVDPKDKRSIKALLTWCVVMRASMNK